ncbi:hypothetical protein [Streptacidiphilus sp. EB103A]
MSRPAEPGAERAARQDLLAPLGGIEPTGVVEEQIWTRRVCG